MKIFLFFGPPGSGKGTQASLLQQKFSNIAYLSTGDLIRKNIQEKTEIGKIALNYINQGLLVPSEIINEMVKEEVKNFRDVIILDGYPRTVDQLHFLINNIANPYLTIFFDLSLEKVIERISLRRICPNCNSIYHLIYNKPKQDEICDKCNNKLVQRDDDKEEVVKKRYEIYINETLPILEELKKLNFEVIKVDASLKIEEIFQNILHYFYSIKT